MADNMKGRYPESPPWNRYETLQRKVVEPDTPPEPIDPGRAAFLDRARPDTPPEREEWDDGGDLAQVSTAADGERLSRIVADIRSHRDGGPPVDATVTAQRFRKKPVVIEAMQYDGSMDAQRTIVNWANGRIEGMFSDHYVLHVHTLEGTMTADPGDWIIKGVAGEFYPCKPDIFDATYEPVEETP